MPSFPRQVAFAGNLTVSRQPHSDELRAIQKFAGHASRCPQCASPWETHVNGSTLCDRGHHYAQKVAVYVYNRAGKAYSAMDRNDGYAPTQIEIPVSCEAVRELLRAMEHGLRIRKPPMISYDRTYPIPARAMTAPQLPSPQVIQVVSRRHPHHATARRSEKKYVAGRGSLYASDMNDRQRRYLVDSGVYHSTSSGRYDSRGDMVLNDSRRFYP